jgi:hypothetical protein
VFELLGVRGTGRGPGCRVHLVHPVRSVRPAALSVQLERLVLVVVFLVMNRSSVRFRQAAQKAQVCAIYRLHVRVLIIFVERFVERVRSSQQTILRDCDVTES